MDYRLLESKNLDPRGVEAPQPLGVHVNASYADLEHFGYLIWS